MALKKPSIHFGSKSRSKAEVAPKNLGQQGMPLDRAHPFYFGFLAATGAIIAITLLRGVCTPFLGADSSHVSRCQHAW